MLATLRFGLSRRLGTKIISVHLSFRVSANYFPYDLRIYDGTHVLSEISASHISYIEWRAPWSFLSWNVAIRTLQQPTQPRGLSPIVSYFREKGIDYPFEIACDSHGPRFCCLPRERLQLRFSPVYIIFAAKEWPASQQLHTLDGYGILSFLSTHKTLHISVLV